MGHAVERLRPSRVLAAEPPSPVDGGEQDFLPEVHRGRLGVELARAWGEHRTEKTAHTADAKQKRKTK